MSFDPQGYDQGGHEDPSAAAETTSELASQKTTAPAVCLIGIGVLNLIGAGLLVYFGIAIAGIPPDQLEAELNKNPRNAEQLQQWHDQGYTTEDILNLYRYGFIGSGLLGLVAAVLSIAGGAAMHAHKGYSLAMVGSIVTAVPCLSPASCCLIGVLVGIWGVIVLLNPTVKAAFK